MSRFDECLKFVLLREGSYVDLPEDRGGPTNKGITQRTYSDYRQYSGLPPQPVKFATDDEIASVYRNDYWNACNCRLLPDGLDLVVFDSAVNHGVRQASKFLQRALGIEADGIIGPMTVAAAQADEEAGTITHTCADMISQRGEFYREIVRRDPSQSRFINGWMNRLKALAKETEVA